MSVSALPRPALSNFCANSYALRRSFAWSCAAVADVLDIDATIPKLRIRMPMNRCQLKVKRLRASITLVTSFLYNRASKMRDPPDDCLRGFESPQSASKFLLLLLLLIVNAFPAPAVPAATSRCFHAPGCRENLLWGKSYNRGR